MDDAEMQAVVEPSVIEKSALQKFKLTVLAPRSSSSQSGAF